MTELERDIARAVIAFYATLGCHVSSTQDRRPRATRVTPGFPDLFVMRRALGGWFHELKAPTGKQSPAQIEFQATCGRCGVPYIVGGVAEAAAYLQQRGLIAHPTAG